MAAIILYQRASKPEEKQANPMAGKKKEKRPPRPRAELTKLVVEEALVDQLMDYSELEKHNGKNGAKAYIACKGLVYDCSSNEVYCEGGGYNCFAGADATVSLATMEFKDVGKSNWRKLDVEKLEVLDEWVKWY